MFCLFLYSYSFFADFVNCLAYGIVPPDLSSQQKRKFWSDVKHYFWDEPYLYKIYANQVIHRCVLEEEMDNTLYHCHALNYGGHFGANHMAYKVF